jgi:hypothetical protein
MYYGGWMVWHLTAWMLIAALANAHNAPLAGKRSSNRGTMFIRGYLSPMNGVPCSELVNFLNLNLYF